MLRGAIDYITETEIGGWVYSELGPVKRRLVLAYCDGKCIGAGPIEKFRQDLLDAGLDDGVLGFRFPISKIDSEQLRRVNVKLEGGDFVLGQSATAGVPSSHARAVQSRADLEWMRSRRWLTQTEFDLLKYLLQAGAYEKLLPAPTPGQPYLHVREVATASLELFCMSDVRLVEETVPMPVDFAGYASGLQEKDCPIVGLWCPEKVDMTVVEGSQRASAAESVQRTGAVHSLGPDRIMFLDVRAKCMWRSSQPGDSQVTLFRATLPDSC